jgi:hypothetical protein
MSYYKTFSKKRKHFFSSLSDRDKLENFLNAVARINLNNCLTLLSTYHPKQIFLTDKNNTDDCKKDKHIFETTSISDINQPRQMRLFNKKIYLKDFFEEFDSNTFTFTKFEDGKQYKGYFIAPGEQDIFLKTLQHYGIENREKYNWLLLTNGAFISLIRNYKLIFELLDKLLEKDSDNRLKLNISNSDENKLLRIQFYCESLNSEDLINLFFNEVNNNKLTRALDIAYSLSESGDLGSTTYREDLINTLKLLLGIKQYKSPPIELHDPESHVIHESTVVQDNFRLSSAVNTDENNSNSGFSFPIDPANFSKISISDVLEPEFVQVTTNEDDDNYNYERSTSVYEKPIKYSGGRSRKNKSKTNKRKTNKRKTNKRKTNKRKTKRRTNKRKTKRRRTNK